MSISVEIIAMKPATIYESNITYNLSPMYYKAIDKEKGIRKLNDMTCKEALPIINGAIKDMIENKEEYEKLNPENGWGSYDGLLRELRNMRNICEENEDGYFYVE